MLLLGQSSWLIDCCEVLSSMCILPSHSISHPIWIHFQSVELECYLLLQHLAVSKQLLNLLVGHFSRRCALRQVKFNNVLYSPLDLFVWRVVLALYSFLNQRRKYFKFWHFSPDGHTPHSTVHQPLGLLSVFPMSSSILLCGRLPTNSYYKASKQQFENSV